MILEVIIYSALILLFLWIYCRLTVGRCDCLQDMTGKTVLITGASAGIGKETALDLARRNARILLACRNLEKAERVKSEIVSATGNTNLEVKLLDLDSFDSVRKCAEDVKRTEMRLDVLINNAGSLFDQFEVTKDGCERLLQRNYFGHFLLTLLLLDLLKKSKPSRIINVSSIIYFFGRLNLNDLFKQNFFELHFGNLYHRSKLANILFTKELSRKLEGTGVTVNALHPGMVSTNLFWAFEHPVLHIFRFFTYILGKSAEEGAQTSVYLAVHPEVEKKSGKFFYDCQEHRLFGKARDGTFAKRLFDISEKIVGKTYPDR